MEKKPVKPAAGKEAERPTGKIISFSKAFPARVEEVVGKTGTRGGIIQVRCKVLEGRDQNKIITRNVMGPTKRGDILLLRETEIEARRMKRGRK